MRYSPLLGLSIKEFDRNVTIGDTEYAGRKNIGKYKLANFFPWRNPLVKLNIFLEYKIETLKKY